jgi:hypothetical protein
VINKEYPHSKLMLETYYDSEVRTHRWHKDFSISFNIDGPRKHKTEDFHQLSVANKSRFQRKSKA